MPHIHKIIFQLAALLHGKLDYDDLFVNQGLFPDDHRSNSAPPTQQLLSARRGQQEGNMDPEQLKYYQDAQQQQQQQQPWQLWQHGNEDGKKKTYFQVFLESNIIYIVEYQQDPRGFNAYSGKQQGKAQEESLASRRQRNLVDLIQQVKKYIYI